MNLTMRLRLHFELLHRRWSDILPGTDIILDLFKARLTRMNKRRLSIKDSIIGNNTACALCHGTTAVMAQRRETGKATSNQRQHDDDNEGNSALGLEKGIPSAEP